MLEAPSVIIAGIESQVDPGSENLIEEQARADRDLREVQMEEDRLIRLYLAGRITEDQLDHQRKFISERLENLPAKLRGYQAHLAMDATKLQVAQRVQEWARRSCTGAGRNGAEEQGELLQNVVDEITVDRETILKIRSLSLLSRTLQLPRTHHDTCEAI